MGLHIGLTVGQQKPPTEYRLHPRIQIIFRVSTRQINPCDGGSTNRTLPMHTDDNYVHFYIGEHDGAVKADSDDSKDNLGYHGCPTGHTQEYCAGFKDDYNSEGYLLNDA